MSEYVRKDGIADIEVSGGEHGLIRQEEAGSRPLALAGEAGKMEVKSQFIELRAKG